jgi:L-alanine-DL-glutamate epimerase-like enolase superfamily enzyme
MPGHRIAKFDIHLVASPVPGNFADSTRKVETIGLLVLRVTTDQGLEGIGITYHEVGGEATRELIRHDIAHRLIGRDPFETDALWHELFHYLRGVGRKGLTFCALSAVDIALWDLKGKILGMPLHRLLGGNRTRVPVYASGGWTSYDDDQLVDEMKGMVARGFRHIKFKVGVDGGRDTRRDAIRVRKVRDAVGPEIHLLVDANNCFDAARAVQLANEIRECRITLFEEPVFADDIPGLARFKRGTDIPLGTGEHEYTKFGVRDLLLAEAADYVQADGARAGGYTEMLKIAALTQAFNVSFAPHAMENIHLPLAAALPNVPFLERLLMFEPVTALVFRDAPVPVDGFMHATDKPGLGLDLDLDFVREADSRGG